MGDVVRFPKRRHGRASKGSGRKKASIGTSPPERSLRRFARPKEASLRPAKMLRRCDSEHCASEASFGTVIPFRSAHVSIGCESDMDQTISIRNGESQPKIFPLEISLGINGLLKCDMGKKRQKPATGLEVVPPEIFLLRWLAFEGIGVTQAADKIGVSQSYVSNIGAGRRPTVNIVYLLALSDLLEITINDFYRPPPSEAETFGLQGYSARAQATILKHINRKPPPKPVKRRSR